MSSENPPRPTLFLLEDSQELSADVTRLAQRMGWNVSAARSLEEAKRVCSVDGLAVQAALIDLMLPVSEQDLQEVDDLLMERAAESEKLTKRQTRTEAHLREIQEANTRIDAIDQQIMRRIDDDGGVQFLMAEHGKALLATCPVAIFTARRTDSVSKSTNQKLASAVMSALQRPPDAWFEKPVSPLSLEQWLEEARHKTQI